MKRIFSAIAIAAFFFGSGISFVRAQSYLDQADLSIKLSDPHPQPGEVLSGIVSSQTLDIDTVPISWYVNDALVSQGTGDKQASLGVIPAGKTVIRAEAGTADSDLGTATAEQTLELGSLSLAWQANSYVPPFYKGKALYPPQGLLTFVALPFFSRTQDSLGSSGNIVYNWKKDNQPLADKSGFGRNTFAVQGQIVDRPIKIEVTATNLDTGETGYASTVIASQKPSILFYENNPLSGLIFNKALSSQINLASPEISLFAAPFGISTESLPFLSFGWNMNGTPLDATSSLLTLRSQDGVSGISAVSLRIDSDKPLQRTDGAINLSYGAGQTSTTSPFHQ